MQKRRNFIALALELRPFCIKPLTDPYIAKQTKPITAVVEYEWGDRGW